LTFSLSLHRSMQKGDFKPLILKRTRAKTSPAQPLGPVYGPATRKVRLPKFKHTAV